MGCFDSTCPITGFPIKYKDPVMWTLIVRTGYESKCYPAEEFPFVFPLLNGIYDDYGTVEWDSIKSNIIFKHVFGNLKLMIKDNKETDEKEVFRILSSRDAVLQTRYGEFPVEIWFVHKWIYKWMIDFANKKEKLPSQTIKQIDNFSIKFGSCKIESIGLHTWKIVGEQGFLHDILHEQAIGTSEEFASIKKPYLKAIKDTLKFIHTLHPLRKMITPVSTHGQQHEGYRALPEYFEFLSNKIKIDKEKWLKP